ncbi:MAG: hypothetical protein JWM40_1252, partial [Frankiales bacterium]|nr:hypothetical protein [Frankiales bacterium]
SGGGSLTLVGASTALATTLRINGLGSLIDRTPKALRVVS